MTEHSTDSIDFSQLFAAARSTAANAYSPYSEFQVGAAILLESGEVFSGCNVEHGSYGLSNCAERTAVFSAVAALGPSVRIRAVAVVALQRGLVYPCGACRQVLNEFSDPSVPVAMERTLGSSEDPLIATMETLIPYELHL